jgi:hypothetical protein
MDYHRILDLYPERIMRQSEVGEVTLTYNGLCAEVQWVGRWQGAFHLEMGLATEMDAALWKICGAGCSADSQ